MKLKVDVCLCVCVDKADQQSKASTPTTGESSSQPGLGAGGGGGEGGGQTESMDIALSSGAGGHGVKVHPGPDLSLAKVSLTHFSSLFLYPSSFSLCSYSKVSYKQDSNFAYCVVYRNGLYIHVCVIILPLFLTVPPCPSFP